MIRYLLVIILTLSPSICLGAISFTNGRYNTTFDCAEWTTYSQTLDCDGINKYGSWTTADGHSAEIVSAANYSSGDGGRGYRWWVGTGTNNNSGNIRFIFNSPPSKLWMRWYQRYQSGFNSAWDTFKNVWYGPDIGGRIVWRPSTGQVDLLSNPTNSVYGSNEGYGVDYYATGTSDGSWQCFEVFIDLDNSLYKHWHNDALIQDWGSGDSVDYAGATAINYLDLTVNMKNVNNGGDMYVDIDDLVMSTTGQIGCVGTPDPNEPARSNHAPASLLPSGTTQTTMSITTDTNATCKYGTVAETAYASIANTFSTTGGTSHSQTLTGLTDSSTTTYYVRCDNGVSNTMDYQIVVAVGPTQIMSAGANELIVSGANKLID